MTGLWDPSGDDLCCCRDRLDGAGGRARHLATAGHGPRRCWWRDDDAVTRTRALDRAARRSPTDAALDRRLAVMPGDADAARWRSGWPIVAAVTVLQHGWMHTNHAPAARRKSELGAHRALPASARSELGSAGAPAPRHFGTARSRVLVPPWNRIAPDLVAAAPRGWPASASRSSGRAAECHAQPRRSPGQHPRRLDRLARDPRLHRRDGGARTCIAAAISRDRAWAPPTPRSRRASYPSSRAGRADRGLPAPAHRDRDAAASGGALVSMPPRLFAVP